MKRFLTLLLAAAMVLSFAACGDNGTTIRNEKEEDNVKKDPIAAQYLQDLAVKTADYPVLPAMPNESELDEAFSTIDYDKMGADAYEQAQAAIVKVKRNLGYATITSPIDGVVISRAVEEGQTVAAGFETPTLFTIANDLTQMLSSVITVGGSLYMMLTLSPLLVLVFAVTIPMSMLFTRYRAKRVRPLYRTRSRKLGEMNGYVEETVSGLKTIKAYGLEEVFLQRFHDKSDAAADANYNADAFGSITGPSVNFVSNLSLAMVSLFGALMYMAGGVSLGNISSFVLYSRKFSGPINEFANLISELQSALAAAERVLALIDAEPEQPDAPDAVPMEHCQGQISLRDVCFGYESGREILHHISAEVQPGRVIAIVGATGCGKTTLINLLMRFYDVVSGEVLLDGRDIRAYQRQSLRRQYTMVLQDTWLFEGTI